MPKFVYKLFLIILLITALNVAVMVYLDPDMIVSKVVFTLLFFASLILLIPSLKVVILSLVSKEKIDLVQKFKQSFKQNLLNSGIISLLLFLKLFKYIGISTILAAGFILLVVIPSFTKLKKSRKRRIY